MEPKNYEPEASCDHSVGDTYNSTQNNPST